MTKENDIKKQDLVVTRIIDAPVELVWKAWTEPKRVMRWWGPKDYTSPSCKIDLREGGKYLFCMRAPKDQGGQEMYSAGVYKKILPLELLEFTQSMADKDGKSIDPAQMGRIEVKFADKNKFGVLDHDVTLPSGAKFYNPMRVFPNNDGSEIIFTLYQQPDVTDQLFSEDAEAVTGGLKKLKTLLENS
ncbi:MAG: SRPBCC domain-containing protein [Candidatus Methanoperedens sp.]|nr:SRPBCC domain-containing protein [Candidatus Methanoperedens sp.]